MESNTQQHRRYRRVLALPRRWMRALAVVAAIPALAGAAMIGSATPQAQAQIRPDFASFISTDAGRPAAVAVCSEACGTLGRTIEPANGTGAGMICWETVSSFDGNYTSNRYFIVNISGQSGEWFIHSSYVFDQTSVPNCG